MSNITMYTLFMVTYIVTGGIDIWVAVDHYKNGHYFRFGVFLLVVFLIMCAMAKLVFTFGGA